MYRAYLKERLSLNIDFGNWHKRGYEWPQASPALHVNDLPAGKQRSRLLKKLHGIKACEMRKYLITTDESI